MVNAYSPQPLDRGGNVLVGYPSARQAEGRYASNNASASSVITMDTDTTVVEVTAGTVPALFRWVASSDTTASVTATNFDHAVGVNQTRRFAVPIESQGVPSIVGYGAQNGLFARYAFMSTGVGSVLTSEFR